MNDGKVQNWVITASLIFCSSAFQFCVYNCKDEVIRNILLAKFTRKQQQNYANQNAKKKNPLLFGFFISFMNCFLPFSNSRADLVEIVA